MERPLIASLHHNDRHVAERVFTGHDAHVEAAAWLQWEMERRTLGNTLLSRIDRDGDYFTATYAANYLLRDCFVQSTRPG